MNDDNYFKKLIKAKADKIKMDKIMTQRDTIIKIAEEVKASIKEVKKADKLLDEIMEEVKEEEIVEANEIADPDFNSGKYIDVYFARKGSLFFSDKSLFTLDNYSLDSETKQLLAEYGM
jgi:ribosomal protein L3